MSTLLADLRVIALDDAAEGALARFLQSMGARVTRATLTQSSRPASIDTQLDVHAASDLSVLLRGADVLIDRVGTEVLADAGWPQSRLRQEYPALIHVSVTPFGSGGPRGRWHGSELVASAMGGTLRVTGEPDRPPVKEALDACWFHADMAAAAGAMAALYERDGTKLGQHVDVSVQEVAFSRNVNGVLVWQFDRRKLERVGGALNYGRATVRCIWALADGFCFHSLMTGRFGAPANQALSDWIDEAGLPNPLQGTNWQTYNRSTLPAETRRTWEAAIEAFFRARTRAEIATEGRRRGINATVVAEPSDVLADDHLEARGFWATENGARAPGRFVRVTSPNASTFKSPDPVSQPRPAFEGALAAPSPSQSSSPSPISSSSPSTSSASSSSSASMSHATSPSPPRAAQPRVGPLAGVRVLDFSWALVGSITTKVLGDLGCDVIKVESRTRPCLSRIDVQVSASRPDSFDDKPWFAHLNTSKRSLALDMKKPESREVLNPLIDWADVVVENFSPGTMAKLNLDYERLAQRNPALVMISGSVFGQTGPLAQEWGVDGTGAALSSRTYLTGWPDRNPVIPGAVPYGDVIVPYVMAAATAAALERRRQTGHGCHIDAAMYEICAQQMYDAIISASKGERPERKGNDDPAVFHQGVYPTKGADRWIAITLRSEKELHSLCALAGIDPGALVRVQPNALADWTRTQDEVSLMNTLQSHGIAAGVVQDVEDLIEHDPQLAFRGALVSLDHKALGAFGHVRTPITFSRNKVMPFRPPQIGEHNREIASLAGLSEARTSELESHGVFK